MSQAMTATILLFIALTTAALGSAQETILDDYTYLLDPPPLFETEDPPVPTESRALGELVATLTTKPERLSPREGTLIITLTHDTEPARNEAFTLRLEGRKRVLAQTNVVTDNEGRIELATYFSSPGEYTLTLTNDSDAVTFPVTVRGTRLLIIGFLVASGVLLALLFERKFP